MSLSNKEVNLLVHLLRPRFPFSRGVVAFFLIHNFLVIRFNILHHLSLLLVNIVARKVICLMPLRFDRTSVLLIFLSIWYVSLYLARLHSSHFSPSLIFISPRYYRNLSTQFVTVVGTLYFSCDSCPWDFRMRFTNTTVCQYLFSVILGFRRPCSSTT